jgi:hypothetical protein
MHKQGSESDEQLSKGHSTDSVIPTEKQAPHFLEHKNGKTKWKQDSWKYRNQGK